MWQIVRADLAELLDVLLDGAPYGYTPFCNDRPEMEGASGQCFIVLYNLAVFLPTLSLVHAFKN